MLGRGHARLAKRRPPQVTGAQAPLAAVGEDHPMVRAIRRDPPGGGITLGRAINRTMLETTLAGAGYNLSAHAGSSQSRIYMSKELRSPQQFTRMTTQGSPQLKENIAPTAGIRLARPAMSRNRGRL